MNPNVDLPGKEVYQASLPELSPFVTVVAFDAILPLARVPVPIGQGDDSSKGPYVLAFRNEETWRQAWRTCQEKIAAQCQAGSKVGCSLSASKACGRSWWKPDLPFLGLGVDDQSKREECEEREMRGCLASSHERCSMYARETCDPVYANMRIAAPGAPIDRRFSGKPLRRPRVTRHDRLIPEATQTADSPEQAESSNPGTANLEAERTRLGVTTFRGQLLMEIERRDERERISSWSSYGAHGDGKSSFQQTIPEEGWVGGLVHPTPAPALRESSPAYSEKDDSGSKGTIFTASVEWWQKFQQSLMKRFSL